VTIASSDSPNVTIKVDFWKIKESKPISGIPMTRTAREFKEQMKKWIFDVRWTGLPLNMKICPDLSRT
jgi:hypothetical protein